MSTEIKFQGLTEFEEKLKMVINKYPIETEKELSKLGKILKTTAIEKTQERVKVHTGKLLKSYKLSKVKVSIRGTSYVTLKDTAPHFHLIENGHKIVTNRGSNNFTPKGKRRVSKGVQVGFVEGKHMLEDSTKELDQGMQAELEEWVEGLIGGIK